MAKNPEEVTVDGKTLTCQICGGSKFYTRKSQLNTAGMSLLNLDWLNKDATNYICSNCGYMFWFLK